MSTRRTLEYSGQVATLFATTPRAGDAEPGTGRVVAGEAGRPEAGAWVRLSARIEGSATDERRFAEVRFRAWGCPHTIAAAAWVAGRLEGRSATATTAADLTPQAIAVELDIPAGKLGRLLVVEDAIRALIGRAAGPAG